MPAKKAESQFSMDAITRKKDARKKKMAVRRFFSLQPFIASRVHQISFMLPFHPCAFYFCQQMMMMISVRRLLFVFPPLHGETPRCAYRVFPQPAPVAQVAWWAKRQRQYRTEGSVDPKGVPSDGSSPGYWCAPCHT